MKTMSGRWCFGGYLFAPDALEGAFEEQGRLRVETDRPAERFRAAAEQRLGLGVAGRGRGRGRCRGRGLRRCGPVARAAVVDGGHQARH